jgi:hypothetical protein
MPWLQRWNFIERARIERLLWDAFENGENIDGMVEQCRAEVGSGGSAEATFRLEVWETTLQRIRRIEAMMRDRPRPGGD